MNATYVRLLKRVAERLGIRGLLSERPYRLSCCRWKLVALASVLVYEPDLLLLDGPLASLDAASSEKIVDIVEEYRERDRVVVIAMHSVDVVLETATRFCSLRDGVTTCMGLEGFLNPSSVKVSRKPLTLRALEEACNGSRACTIAILEKVGRPSEKL